MPRRLAAVPDIDPNTIDALLPSFTLAIRAASRSPRTIALHVGGARRFVAFLETNNRSTAIGLVTTDDVRGFIVARRDAGLAGNSVASDFRAVRALYRWAVDERLTPVDPTDRVRVPKAAQPVTPVFSDDELKRLFDACKGSDFISRRDLAMLRLLVDTGMRRGELLALSVSDIDTKAGIAHVVRGKGGRGRVVGFGAKAGVALDRYLRVRRAHRHADLPALWLGRSRAMTYGSVRDAIAARAAKAGVDDAHLHKFRHTHRRHQAARPWCPHHDANARGGNARRVPRPQMTPGAAPLHPPCR